MKQSELEAAEIAELEQRIERQTPSSGRLLLTADSTKYSRFSDFPLSQLTLKGLQRGKFTQCTEIQRQTLLHALAGRDILGASKTGSGKTLAFLVPVVERLFRSRASRDDVNVVFALVVSPTRELSSQIYEMAKVLTSQHAFNIGLLVGGSEFKHQHNIQLAVGTPGRVLQHLEQSPQFDVSQLQVLVFDEADRLLDMGFSEQITNILSYLPPRQTMLFSATQTRKIKDLALMSMTSPEFVSCFTTSAAAAASNDDNDDNGNDNPEQDKKKKKTDTASVDKPLMTPKQLQQQYVVCDIGDKLQLVHDFLQQHCEQRSICFFTSCKQVKFVETCFRRMRIGLPVFALHGKQTADKRRIIYDQFCETQKKASGAGAVLLATDVAARGLDFPHVDWVVQADCPEDAATYIHRVGRTARNGQVGKAVLLLLPNEEEEFVRQLKDYSNVNLQKKQAAGVVGKKDNKHDKKTAPTHQLQARLQDLLVKDPELKLLAQKAFKSYLRSVHFQPNQRIFDLKKISFAQFAQSLGLGQTPRIKFAKLGGEQGRKQLREVKNQSRLGGGGGEGGSSDEDDDDDNDDDDDKKNNKKKKTDKISKMMNRAPQQQEKKKGGGSDDSEDDGDDGEDFFTSKSSSTTAADLPAYVPQRQAVKKPKVLRIAPSGLLKGAKSNLTSLDDDNDDDGAAVNKVVALDQGFVQRVAARLKQEDELVDRGANRKRVQDMHKERKRLQKAEQEQDDNDDDDGGRVAVLASGGSDDDDDLEQRALRLIQKS